MLITVVVPTYNRRDLLARCLPSLFGQTCRQQECEVVVVIDGATDDTRDYLRALKFPCVSQVIEQENLGQAAARNSGMRAARGQYILLLDDDFICDPGLIQQHLDAHDGSACVVIGPILQAHTDRSIPALAIEREISPYYQRLEAAAPQIPWLPPNSSFSRDLLLRLGGYDERFTSAREDTDLGIRLANVGVKFRYAPNAIVHQQYDKSADQLVSEAALFGKHDVMLARKFPLYGAQSNLSRLNSGAAWKRDARYLVATLPFSPEPFLYPFYVVSTWLSKVPLLREAAIRLLNLRRYIVWIRAALREAGGWSPLVSLNAQPASFSRAVE